VLPCGFQRRRSSNSLASSPQSGRNSLAHRVGGGWVKQKPESRRDGTAFMLTLLSCGRSSHGTSIKETILVAIRDKNVSPFHLNLRGPRQIYGYDKR
jgi:hypothetical protein